MAESYQAQLQRAWAGEVQGEAFFAALAEQTTDREWQQKWHTLAELERRTGAALEPIVEAGQDTRLETGPAVAAARELAAEPMPQGLASLVTVIDSAVDAYNTLRDTGPDAHKVELDILARHEIALQTFIRRELAGQPADSLEEVDELLQELRSLQQPE